MPIGSEPVVVLSRLGSQSVIYLGKLVPGVVFCLETIEHTARVCDLRIETVYLFAQLRCYRLPTVVYRNLA